MAEKNNNMNIPKEKFSFVQENERIFDKKLEDKPIGYFRDALIRFRKSKASVVAFFIIVIIVLYALIVPLVSPYEIDFMCNMYQRKPARVTWMRDSIGIMDGGVNREVTEAQMIRLVSIGVGAANYDSTGATVAEGLEEYCQPVIKIRDVTQSLDQKKQPINQYDIRVDTYLEVGFLYVDIEQSALQPILDWQEQTGLRVLYPLVENNEYNPDYSDANNWYKAVKIGRPVNANGKQMAYSDDMVLEDNYKRDAEGNLVYWMPVGGGNNETHQWKVRVLYYNYYQYLYGTEPNYIMGTESQGYDMALRIADGIQLSLIISLGVCIINFILGALYGAVEGYYGGWIDLVLERISDILSGVPFIVVATLFQLHLAQKVGPVVCLLFAYVVTGWIGTAYRVRTQFYRFKNQEYVMAARTLGARDRRIIWKHIFPNTLGTIITSSALAIPSTIMSESMLSFLGIVNLGGAEGTSLGTLLSDAQDTWINHPHLMLYPAIVISLLMISFNLFGNGLRDAFNPALRGTED